MKAEIQEDGILFTGVNAYKPPAAVEKIAAWVCRQIQAEVAEWEGNNDRGCLLARLNRPISMEEAEDLTAMLRGET